MDQNHPSWLSAIGETSQLHSLIKGNYLLGHDLPRIAFVGRSNVGKSSLINALLGSKKLARVSKQPGKTRLIHFFIFKEERHILVDLPGYGFAKVSQKEQESWNQFIESYLKFDPKLLEVCVLLDSKIGPTPKDFEAMSFFKTLGVALFYIMTKSDQLKTQSARAKRKFEIEGNILKGEKIFWISTKDPHSILKLKKELFREEF